MALLGIQYDGTDDSKDPLVNFHGPDYLTVLWLSAIKSIKPKWIAYGLRHRTKVYTSSHPEVVRVISK